MADEAVLNANGSVLTPSMVRMAFNQVKQAGKTPTSFVAPGPIAKQWESRTFAGCEVIVSSAVPAGTIGLFSGGELVGKIINIGEPTHAR